jgi:hypothetical protein
MGLIIFLVVGLIAGAIASYVMGRQQDLLINRRRYRRRGRGLPRRPHRPWRLQPDWRDHHRHLGRHFVHLHLAADALTLWVWRSLHTPLKAIGGSW